MGDDYDGMSCKQPTISARVVGTWHNKKENGFFGGSFFTMTMSDATVYWGLGFGSCF